MEILVNFMALWLTLALLISSLSQALLLFLLYRYLRQMPPIVQFSVSEAAAKTSPPISVPAPAASKNLWRKLKGRVSKAKMKVEEKVSVEAPGRLKCQKCAQILAPLPDFAIADENQNWLIHVCKACGEKNRIKP